MIKGFDKFLDDYDSMVDTLVMTGVFTEDQARQIMIEKRKEKILEIHNYHIWKAEDRGRIVYRSKVATENGAKKIQSTSKEKLENMIVEYYLKQAKEGEKKRITLRTLYPEWLSQKEKIKTTSTIKRNTVSWKRYYLNEPLSQDLLDTPLGKIDGMDLNAYVHQMIRKHEMNPHMYGDFSSIIRQMFDYADYKRYISTNPFDMVKVRNRDELYAEEKKESAESIFNVEELSRLIEYSWRQYYDNRQYVQRFVPLAIIFLFYTGLRLGEVVALKFSDVDRDILHVRRMFSQGAKDIVKRVKRGEYRDISLIPEALEIIEIIRERKIELGLPLDYIFTPDEQRVFSTYKSIPKMLGRYCDELGLFKHSPHDARRTFVSHLKSQGCPAQTIMELTGHRDYKTFSDSYLFDTEQHEQKKDYIRAALVK